MSDPEGGILSIPEPVEGGTESTESLGFLDSLTGSRAALVRAEEEVAALARPTQEWADQFECPIHGRVPVAEITTKKTHLGCRDEHGSETMLNRALPLQCGWHGHCNKPAGHDDPHDRKRQ